LLEGRSKPGGCFSIVILDERTPFGGALGALEEHEFSVSEPSERSSEGNGDNVSMRQDL